MTIYVFGGWPDGNRPTEDLYRIRLATATPCWEKIEPQGPRPAPRNGAATVFDRAGGRLIVVGGDGGSNNRFRPLGDRWQFDLAGNCWSQLQE